MLIVVIFRSRLNLEHLDEYRVWAARIDALAKATPGFLGIQSYTADDGERVAISRFENEAALNAWREHPQHREAQRLGREKFYSWFSIEVSEVVRSYDFPPTPT